MSKVDHRLNQHIKIWNFNSVLPKGPALPLFRRSEPSHAVLLRRPHQRLLYLVTTSGSPNLMPSTPTSTHPRQRSKEIGQQHQYRAATAQRTTRSSASALALAS